MLVEEKGEEDCGASHHAPEGYKQGLSETTDWAS